MAEWIKLSERLPREGQSVEIRMGKVVIKNVLFQERRFWQYRTGPDAGLAYAPDDWRPIQDIPEQAREKLFNKEAAK